MGPGLVRHWSSVPMISVRPSSYSSRTCAIAVNGPVAPVNFA